MDILQIELNYLKNKILPFLINNPIDVSTPKGIDAMAESLGFKNKGAGFYILEVDEEWMWWSLNAVHDGSRVLYCYLPITYFVELNEGGEAEDFEDLNAYEKAIDKYNLDYTRCLDSIKEILGQPMLEGQFTTALRRKSFNNFGRQETYQYAVWQNKNLFFILQQDVPDITPGFEDDIDFAIITNENFRTDLLPLSRLTSQ